VNIKGNNFQNPVKYQRLEENFYKLFIRQRSHVQYTYRTQKTRHHPVIPLLGTYPKKCNTGYSKGTCTPIFISGLFTIASYGNNQDAHY
jgi:hypothetical protein